MKRAVISDQLYSFVMALGKREKKSSTNGQAIKAPPPELNVHRNFSLFFFCLKIAENGF